MRDAAPVEPAGAAMDKYLGLYRGTLMNANDPAGRGRVQVAVPGCGEGWAPVASPLGTAAPGPAARIGTTVWVMFEGGNSASPVVIGALSTP
ncbi:phage baseplate assembly protein V [Falsiroseomonas sp. CW058]|uniref:phage baseplate assembly protein V n=1 Tax=Falsiroseomonas sp. CW058 TaxID=3388664 RepID=UPI003D31E3AD